MTITLSETQSRAIAAIRDWYGTRRHEQQIFRLFGYLPTTSDLSDKEFAGEFLHCFGPKPPKAIRASARLHRHFRRSNSGATSHAMRADPFSDG